jgi:hypothetical protein
MKIRKFYDGWRCKVACWRVRRHLEALGYPCDMTDEEMVEAVAQVARIHSQIGVSADAAAAAIGRLLIHMDVEVGALNPHKLQTELLEAIDERFTTYPGGVPPA